MSKLFSDLYFNELTPAQSAYLAENWQTSNPYTLKEKSQSYFFNQTATGAFIDWWNQNDDRVVDDQIIDVTDPKYGISSEHILAYDDVFTHQQMVDRKYQINKALKDREMITNAGFMFDWMVIPTLEIMDLIYWIPFLRLKHLSKAQKTLSVTAQTAAFETVRESILQYQNPFRSFEESATNVILGAGFVGAIDHFLTRWDKSPNINLSFLHSSQTNYNPPKQTPDADVDDTPVADVDDTPIADGQNALTEQTEQVIPETEDIKQVVKNFVEDGGEENLQLSLVAEEKPLISLADLRVYGEHAGLVTDPEIREELTPDQENQLRENRDKLKQRYDKANLYVQDSKISEMLFEINKDDIRTASKNPQGLSNTDVPIPYLLYPELDKLNNLIKTRHQSMLNTWIEETHNIIRNKYIDHFGKKAGADNFAINLLKDFIEVKTQSLRYRTQVEKNLNIKTEEPLNFYPVPDWLLAGGGFDAQMIVFRNMQTFFQQVDHTLNNRQYISYSDIEALETNFGANPQNNHIIQRLEKEYPNSVGAQKTYLQTNPMDPYLPWTKIGTLIRKQNPAHVPAVFRYSKDKHYDEKQWRKLVVNSSTDNKLTEKDMWWLHMFLYKLVGETSKKLDKQIPIAPQDIEVNVLDDVINELKQHLQKFDQMENTVEEIQQLKDQQTKIVDDAIKQIKTVYPELIPTLKKLKIKQLKNNTNIDTLKQQIENVIQTLTKLNEDVQPVGTIMGIQGKDSLGAWLRLTPGERLSTSPSLAARQIVEGLSRQSFLMEKHLIGIPSSASVEDHIEMLDQIGESFEQQYQQIFKQYRKDAKNKPELQQIWQDEIKKTGLINKDLAENNPRLFSKTLNQFDGMVFFNAINNTESKIPHVNQVVQLYKKHFDEIYQYTKILNEPQDIQLTNIPRAYNLPQIQNYASDFINHVISELQTNMMAFYIRTLRDVLDATKPSDLNWSDLEFMFTDVKEPPLSFANVVKTLDSILEKYQENPSYDTLVREINNTIINLNTKNIPPLYLSLLRVVDDVNIKQSFQKISHNIFNDINDHLNTGPITIFDKQLDSLRFEDIQLVLDKYVPNTSALTNFKNTFKLSKSFTNTWMTRSASSQLNNYIRHYSPLIAMQRVFGHTDLQTLIDLRRQDQLNIFNNNTYNDVDWTGDNIMLSKVSRLDQILTENKLKITLNELKHIFQNPDENIFKIDDFDQRMLSELKDVFTVWFELNDKWMNSKFVSKNKKYDRLELFERTLKKAIETDDFLDVVKLLKTDPTSSTLIQSLNQDIEDITVIYNRLFNINTGTDTNNVSYKMAQLSKQAASSAFLGGVTISSLADIFRPIQLAGLTPVLKQMFIRFKHAGEYKQFRREMQILAASGEYTRNKRFMSLINMDDDPIYRNKIARRWQGIHRFLMTATGLPYFNEYLKTLTGNIILDLIYRSGKTLSQGKTLNKYDRGRLSTLFLDDDKLIKLYKYLEQYAKPSQEFPDILVAPNIHMWKSQNGEHHELGALLNMAISKTADTVINTPGASSLPNVFDSTVGQLILMFKSFIPATHDQFFIPALQRAGDPNLWKFIAFGLTMGAFITYVKEAERNLSRNKDWDDFDFETGDIVVNAFDRSGILAVMFELNNIMDKLTYNTLSIQNLVGTQEAQRYANRSPIEALLGPWTNQVHVMAILGKMIMNQAIDVPVSDSDINKVITSIPGSRLPGVRQVLTDPAVDEVQTWND